MTTTKIQKIFGTDGVRGLVNVPPIDPISLVKLGHAIGQYMQTHHLKTCLIGKDTRISGPMLESALVSGLIAMGIDIIFVGITPSSGVSLLLKHYDADLGIMISASHNPYHDNGIKLFDKSGRKFLDAQQKEIEKIYFNPTQFPFENPVFGTLKIADDAEDIYINLIKSSFDQKDNLRIVIDCANGAASYIAPKLLHGYFINNEPNGVNINLKCGATDTRVLAQTVLEQKADIGIAFDGDADRLTVVDENGEEIPGEYIMAAFVDFFDYKKIVITAISNPAFRYYLAQKGVEYFICDVGDVKVKERMIETASPVGGEPSGHFILNDFAPTSDAIVSAIWLLNMLNDKKMKASKLRKPFTLKPEVSKNVKLPPDIYEAFDVKQFNATLKITSDFLIRKSGTEKNLRIMMWDNDIENLEKNKEIVIESLKDYLLKKFNKIAV